MRSSTSNCVTRPVARSKIGCATCVKRSSSIATRMRSAHVIRPLIRACACSPRTCRATWLRPASLASYIARSALTSTSSPRSVVGGLEHRDADARGHRALAGAGDRDPLGAQRLEQLVGDVLGRVPRGARQQRGELVAAEPGEHVALAQPRAQHRRDARDDLVAGGVAERVVDVLEVVEVEQQQRAVGAVAAHEVGVRVDLVGEARAVVQAGQRVVRGEVVQVLLVVAAVRDVLHLDEEAPRRARLVGDRRRLQRHPDRRPAGVQEARLDLVLVALARQQRADDLAVVVGVGGCA